MDDNVLSSNSSCQKVSELLAKNYGISEEAQKKLIEEYISGDILPDIPKPDYNKLFSIKPGTAINITKYIEANKDKFKENKIDEKLSSISNEENIKLFLENKLNYKGNLNNLKEKEFLELDEEKMKAFGFKYGQRKKLIKYINYFKNLKKEENKNEKIEKDI